MALLFMDSFDDGLIDGGYKGYGGVPPSGGDISTTYGRNGKGVRIGDQTNDYLYRATGSTDDTLILGFAGYVETLTNGDVMLRFEDGATVQVQFRFYTDGSISAFRGGTLLGNSGAGKFLEDTWQYYEFKVKFANTGGTVDVRVNGVSVLSLSSQDTQDTANAYATNWRLAGASGYLENLYVDDLYLADSTGTVNTDFLGDVKVETLLPNGNGNSSGMTGSDSNQTDNYLLVDDNPVVTTDYVESATEGHKDTYAMGNLASTNVSVYGMQVSLVTQKDDTGSKYLRPVVRSGSTDYAGTSVALNTSWEGMHEIWEQDPNTSADWTPTNVNAVEVGPEVRDS